MPFVTRHFPVGCEEDLRLNEPELFDLFESFTITTCNRSRTGADYKASREKLLTIAHALVKPEEVTEGERKAALRQLEAELDPFVRNISDWQLAYYQYAPKALRKVDVLQATSPLLPKTALFPHISRKNPFPDSAFVIPRQSPARAGVSWGCGGFSPGQGDVRGERIFERSPEGKAVRRNLIGLVDNVDYSSAEAIADWVAILVGAVVGAIDYTLGSLLRFTFSALRAAVVFLSNAVGGLFGFFFGRGK